jgi:hypothetical protein
MQIKKCISKIDLIVGVSLTIDVKIEYENL